MTSLFCIPRRTALCSSAVVIVVAFIVTWRLGVGVVFQPRGISLLVGEEAGKARSVTLRSRENKGAVSSRLTPHQNFNARETFLRRRGKPFFMVL